MYLEEFRTRVVERLKACCDTAVARRILVEADGILTNSRVTRLTHDRLWESLHEELETLAEEARFMTDRQAAMKLSAVVVAAQARIARYRVK